MQASKQARAQQEELIRQVELRRKMRQTVVSTDDKEVRKMLRRLGEPVTIFGEREVRSNLLCLVFGCVLSRQSVRKFALCLRQNLRAGWLQMERRDRLRKLLATMDDTAADALIDQQQQELLQQQQQQSVTEAPTAKVFYTEGSVSLKQARLQVRHVSHAHDGNVCT